MLLTKRNGILPRQRRKNPDSQALLAKLRFVTACSAEELMLLKNSRKGRLSRQNR